MSLKVSSQDSHRSPIEIIMEELHNRYRIIPEYDLMTPVFVDPLNSDNFIELNMDNIEKWARLIVSPYSLLVCFELNLIFHVC